MNTRREFLQKISGSAIALSILPDHCQLHVQAVPGESYDGTVLERSHSGSRKLCNRVAAAMVNCKKAKLDRSDQRVTLKD